MPVSRLVIDIVLIFNAQSTAVVTMADSSQTRIFRKVVSQCWHARWWLWSPNLDAQTLFHFGQAKVWADDDWDASEIISEKNSIHLITSKNRIKLLLV